MNVKEARKKKKDKVNEEQRGRRAGFKDTIHTDAQTW